MKIAFVAGFYSSVKDGLDTSYSAHQANGSLVWVRQRELHREADLTEVSSRLFNLADRADFVRVILHVPRGREWVVASVEAILAGVKAAHPTLDYDIVKLDNDGDRDGVLNAIASYGLAVPSPLDLAGIRRKIPEGKVLCISLDGKTPILEALERAGVPPDAISDCFHEERIAGGKNSNLLQSLASRSLAFRYLLYAFEGLRTLSPVIKHKFAKCWEAPNAAKVVELFKKWITTDEVVEVTQELHAQCEADGGHCAFQIGEVLLVGGDENRIFKGRLEKTVRFCKSQQSTLTLQWYYATRTQFDGCTKRCDSKQPTD